MKAKLFLTGILAISMHMVQAQNNAKPEDTEVWEPVPPKVIPGNVNFATPPSDAIILFDGKNLNEWVLNADRNKPADWTVKNGILTVNKNSGNIETKKEFANYQLHIEWRIPSNITGSGQARGNSGVFLASIGKGDPGYELQVLDSYENKTYVNGMAGSIYKQFVPLANPALKPGQWQTYDVTWTAPVFNDNGSLLSPAKVTVLFNGVVVQNNISLLGPTQYIGKPSYNIKHGASPVKLQAHGDKSEPISFRNIWIRELK
jgi:hypothetical protein